MRYKSILMLCEYCNHSNFIEKDGFIICSNCGIIHDQLYDYSIRYLHESTFMESLFSKGTIFYPDNLKFLKLKKYQDNLMKVNNHALNLQKEIFNCCSYFEIPATVRERALYLYQKLIQNANVTMYVVLVVSIYKACRDYNYPISLKEISEYFKAKGHIIQMSSINSLIQQHKLKIKYLPAKYYLSRIISLFRKNYPNFLIPTKRILFYLTLKKFVRYAQPKYFAYAAVILAYQKEYSLNRDDLLKIIKHETKLFGIKQILKQLNELDFKYQNIKILVSDVNG